MSTNNVKKKSPKVVDVMELQDTGWGETKRTSVGGIALRSRGEERPRGDRLCLERQSSGRRRRFAQPGSRGHHLFGPNYFSASPD
jgi:hypothetical protein